VTAPPPGGDQALAQLQRAVASLYKVEGLLGRGPTTAVYKAAGLNPPRPVALKLLPPGLGADPTARFKDEVRKAQALNHPNIVPVYTMGLRAGAPYFVAMKLVEGRGLNAVIESQGPLPLPAIIVVLRATTEALTYAHGLSTIHGHLHAANILLDKNGHARVSDFGIARALEDATLSAGGKPRLVIPEQAAGGAVGPPSDQYSLGIVALQMLTGSVSADPDPLTSLGTVRSGRAGLPDGLVRLVQTALARDPAQRFASMANVLEAIKAIPFTDADRKEGFAALGQLARGEPVTAAPEPSTSPPGDARTSGPTAAPKAAIATAPAVPAARPTPIAPVAKATPAVPAAPRVSAARPAPVAPTRDAVPAAPAAKAAPAPPTIEAVPAAPRISAEAAAPATPRVSAEAGAPPTPRVSAATPPPAASAEEFVPAELAAPVAPTEHGVLAVPAEPAPKRRLPVVWVLAGLLVVVLAVVAYLVLGRRPAASPTAQAPVPQRPSVPAPSAAPAVPAVAESSRSDTALRTETTGLLLLTAVPPTAEILVDGTASGSNGFVDSEVTAGRRRLRISAPGYVTLDTLVNVRAGSTVDLGRVLLRESGAEGAAPAAQATGRLRLRAVPPTAEIFVDDQSVGVGSLVDFEVAAGQRKLRITAPGYLTLDTLITVDPGTTVRLGQISLKTVPGGP
jgi:hypothetical protein